MRPSPCVCVGVNLVMALEVDLAPGGRIVGGPAPAFVLILLLPCDSFGGGYGSCWANC